MVDSESMDKEIIAVGVVEKIFEDRAKITHHTRTNRSVGLATNGNEF